MNPLPAGVLAAAMSVAFLHPLMAQENRPNQDLIEKIAPISQQLADWHRLLSAQKSLSLVTVELGHVERGFGRDDDPDFSATTKVFYKGEIRVIITTKAAFHMTELDS